MLKIIVHAFVEENKENAVVEIVYASENEVAISNKMENLINQFPNDFLAI
ncbi:hypothetical protein ADO05_02091 [Streptococcus parauberis]|nr:hypothetical protein ADO05_02091 [Streptococcus parauberis]POS67008.1 hypothetical protein AOS90_01470 [Streptococcus parauberis]